MTLFAGILTHYWSWYYIERLGILLKAWRNFLVFGVRFFSIPHLIVTLFAPFHQYAEGYGRGFDPNVWLMAFSSNLIFRTIGAMVRAVFIIAGIAFELIVLIVGLLVVCIWIILPFALFATLILALKLLFVG